LNAKVKGQRSRSQGQKTAFSALSADCVRFKLMFDKTSLASSLIIIILVKMPFNLSPSLSTIVPPPFGGGKLSSHLTQSRLGRDLPPYQYQVAF